jgi:hypothetical protein
MGMEVREVLLFDIPVCTELPRFFFMASHSCLALSLLTFPEPRTSTFLEDKLPGFS